MGPLPGLGEGRGMEVVLRTQTDLATGACAGWEGSRGAGHGAEGEGEGLCPPLCCLAARAPRYPCPPRASCGGRQAMAQAGGGEA